MPSKHGLEEEYFTFISVVNRSHTLRTTRASRGAHGRAGCSFGAIETTHPLPRLAT